MVLVKPQFIAGRDVLADRPEYACHAAALHEYIHAEPRNAGDADGEVEFVFLLEPGLLIVGENAVNERFGVFGAELSFVAAGDEPAGDAHHGRPAGGQVQVRSAVFDGVLEEFSKIHRSRVRLG